MAVADVFNGDMIQHVFKNVNNESVLDLPVHFDKVSNKRYVLWSDLQRTFIGIDHIAVTDEPTLLPARLEHFRDKYTVVWKQASGTEHHSPNDPLRYIRTEFKEYKELHDLLANYNLGYRDTFLRYAATKNYYRRMLLDKLANVKSEDIHTQKMVAEMKQDIATFDQEFPQHDDYDRMQELLQSHYGIFRRSPNRFFLVLPSNFDQWDADANNHRS
ncbi:hypothetical protein BG003_005734 [Podila horticola]|nr:hypothetical protein BG003_005734 [Podila horticola]